MLRYPTYGGRYSNNENCKWYIQPNRTGRYRLHFTMFSLESTYDWVMIGNNTRHSGLSRPDDYYFYDSTTLEFLSDVSNIDYGFRVEIIEVTGRVQLSISNIVSKISG